MRLLCGRSSITFTHGMDSLSHHKSKVASVCLHVLLRLCTVTVYIDSGYTSLNFKKSVRTPIQTSNIMLWAYILFTNILQTYFIYKHIILYLLKQCSSIINSLRDNSRMQHTQLLTSPDEVVKSNWQSGFTKKQLPDSFLFILKQLHIKSIQGRWQKQTKGCIVCLSWSVRLSPWEEQQGWDQYCNQHRHCLGDNRIASWLSCLTTAVARWGYYL